MPSCPGVVLGAGAPAGPRVGPTRCGPWAWCGVCSAAAGLLWASPLLGALVGRLGEPRWGRMIRAR